MKTLILSIQPQHTMNILNRDKILEIRTTVPKEWKDYLSGKTKVKPEPMECLIYCTKGKNILSFDIAKQIYALNIKNGFLNKQVVAEFTLNEVEKFKVFENGSVQNWNACDLEKSCLTYEQIADYVGRRKTGYALHIEDLKIYDKPKSIEEFGITIPPQSWQFIGGKDE